METASASDGECRQAIVLFVDLCGYTALSRRLAAVAAGLPDPPLVRRDAERAQLVAVVDAAASGAARQWTGAKFLA